MSDVPPPPQPKGIVPVELMQPVDAGWTIEELLEHLGPPLAIQRPEDVSGPTDFFESLGFEAFDFEADRNLSEVWVYKHDRRGTFRLKGEILSYVGVRDGKSVVFGSMLSRDVPSERGIRLQPDRARP